MPALRDTSELLVLRRKPRFSGWIGLGWRIAVMAGLLGLLVLIHWLERDGLKDTYDGKVSFLDVIYFTMISATTTGYGDIVPVADSTRMFDAIVVTPIRVLFLLILAGSWLSTDGRVPPGLLAVVTRLKRRGWDSNPRYRGYRYNGFRDRPIQPLSHPSGCDSAG